MTLPRGPSHPTSVLLVEEADFLLEDTRRSICDSPSPTSPVRHTGLEIGGKDTKTKTRSRPPARGEPSPAHGLLTTGNFAAQGRDRNKRLGRLLQPPQSLEAQPGLLGHLRAFPRVPSPRPRPSGSPSGKGPGLGPCRPGLAPLCHPQLWTLFKPFDFPGPQFSHL